MRTLCVTLMAIVISTFASATPSHAQYYYYGGRYAAGGYYNPHTGVARYGAVGPYRRGGVVAGPNGGYAAGAVTPRGYGYTYHTPGGRTVTNVRGWGGAHYRYVR
jgi:hypothetical protein